MDERSDEVILKEELWKEIVWHIRGLCLAVMFAGTMLLQMFGASCFYGGVICKDLNPFEIGLWAQFMAIPAAAVLGGAGVLIWTFLRRPRDGR